MLPCFVTGRRSRGPFSVVGDRRRPPTGWPRHRRRRRDAGSRRRASRPQAGAVALLPGADGGVRQALLVVGSRRSPGTRPAFRGRCRAGDWQLDDPDGLLPPDRAALGWALAAYRFTRYRTRRARTARGWCCPTARRVERALADRRGDLARRAISSTRPPTISAPPSWQAAVAEVADRFGAELPHHRRRGAAGRQLSGDPCRRPRQRPGAAPDRPALGRSRRPRR